MCDFYLRNKKLFEQLDTFIDSLETKDGSLIQVLHHAQGIFGYLPKEVQLYISEKLNIAPAKVYGVVSFYSYFSTNPVGEHKISVCLGTACFVKGSKNVLAELEKQLEIKSEQVLKLFEEQDIRGFEFLGIESSPNNTCYRNKMEFTFGNEMKDGPLTIGMHKKGRHIDILTVDGCMLIDQDFIKILTATEEFFRAEGLPYYRGNDHKGYLRHLVVRKGIKTNEMMVMIVTSTQLDYDMDKYKDMLLGLDLEADLASVLHCLNDNLADAVKCDELRVLHGRDHIYEELLGLRFKISPFSFFQTNTKGAEELYTIAREFVGDHNDKVVFDLYSGTGTIGQVMAKAAKKVYGIEIIEEAVVAANQNAKLNGLDNCEFIAGDVLKVSLLQEMLQKLLKI